MFDHYRFILASGSPRRKELLEGLDIPFTVDTSSSCKEVRNSLLDPEAIPLDLALQKSRSYHRELEKDEILITADTLVFAPAQRGDTDETSEVRCEIMGKPADRETAVEMLKKLSNKTHTVMTGVVLRAKDRLCGFTARTDVTFKQLTDSEIDYYLDNYRPYDKAGAYGVQEWIGHIAITHINGSYYNVMGLPVQQLYTQLERLISSLSNSTNRE